MTWPFRPALVAVWAQLEDVGNEGWALGSLRRAALGRGALHVARAAVEAGHSVARQQGQLIALTAFILNVLGELGTASAKRLVTITWSRGQAATSSLISTAAPILVRRRPTFA